MSEKERNWEEEGEIKRHLWEDIHVNEIPRGRDFEEEICYQEWKGNTIICTVQSIEREPRPRPPSPTCKIS